MRSESADYWLQRLTQSVEKAVAAHSAETRGAYLDLARHYWSMHVMANGRAETQQFAILELIDAASDGTPAQLRRAA